MAGRDVVELVKLRVEVEAMREDLRALRVAVEIAVRRLSIAPRGDPHDLPLPPANDEPTPKGKR